MTDRERDDQQEDEIIKVDPEAIRQILGRPWLSPSLDKYNLKAGDVRPLLEWQEKQLLALIVTAVAEAKREERNKCDMAVEIALGYNLNDDEETYTRILGAYKAQLEPKEGND